jgi:hypothetical protein
LDIAVEELEIRGGGRLGGFVAGGNPKKEDFGKMSPTSGFDRIFGQISAD